MHASTSNSDSSSSRTQSRERAPEASPVRQTKITWAQEPWADDEEIPLLSGQNNKGKNNIRPFRKSKSRGSSRGQFRKRLEDTYLPLYDDSSDGGESSHSRGQLWVVGAAFVISLMVLITYAIGPAHHGAPFPSLPPQPYAFPPSSISAGPMNPAFLIKAKHGAVATENKLCSDIGVQTLKDGGNAADAAVSSTLCVGVVNMFSSGIGGGGFMTVRIPPNSSVPGSSSEVFTIDFRETAPAATNATMYNNNPSSSLFGGLSVGVPGEIRGLAEMHSRLGKLPWRDLVLPSARLANGWKVGRELDRRIKLFEVLMLGQPDWKAVFAPKGKLLKEGDMIFRKPLARTLETIANEGPEAFYKGPIASALLAKIGQTGGIMTQADLDSYKVIVRPAVKGSYRGHRVYTTDAPTSGIALLHMLNLIELEDDFVEDGRSPLNTHRIVEAMKFGFAARTRISDPLVRQDVSRMSPISSKEFAKAVFANMTDDTTHPLEYYNPVYDILDDHGTSHTSIIDKDGMVVSLTSSVNLVFGSAVLDPVTGVILNDQMGDFGQPGKLSSSGVPPSPYNYPQPGKRPLSSITPTIIEDANGNFELALGGSGGSRIFPAIFQVILGVAWGLDISQAIEFPRLHTKLLPPLVDIDEGYPESGINGLLERGHNVSVQDFNRITSVIQAVMVKNGTIYAASDSRKNGIAAGY